MLQLLQRGKSGGQEEKRKTKTDDDGLDDEGWIQKTQGRGPASGEWRRRKFEPA